jgi:hypothetical protein
MTTRTHYYYEEKVAGTKNAWVSAFYEYHWTLEQCRTAVMARKIVSPKSVLRIVKETREVWDWRERSKCK